MRVFGRAKKGPVARGPISELMRIGLADDDGARVSKQAHDLGVPFGNMIGVRFRAHCRAMAGDID